MYEGRSKTSRKNLYYELASMKFTWSWSDLNTVISLNNAYGSLSQQRQNIFWE